MSPTKQQRPNSKQVDLKRPQTTPFIEGFITMASYAHVRYHNEVT